MGIVKVMTSVCIVLFLATGCGAESQTDAASSKLEAEENQTTMIENYLQIPLETITGDTITLADIKGSALLLVNVASKCGYTPQYEGLEALYRQYKDSGLVVVGFPANNFGGQEPGSNEEVLSFCQRRFDVTFPMMAKISVKGGDKHPLFVALTENSPIPGEIEWNFTKLLLDRNGRLVARFPSNVKPMSVELVEKLRPLLERGGA